MSLQDWVSQSQERIKNDGIRRGTSDSLYRLYVSGLRKLNPLFSSGTNVYERNWDLLIILDACRVDALEEVKDEYDFLDNPGSIRSVSSSSKHWNKRTFSDEYGDEIQNTVLISGNGYSRLVEDQPFLAFENGFESSWDDEISTVPAEPITDMAIQAGREYRNDRDRMVVHYMQPHDPSIPDPLSTFDEDGCKTSAWRRVQHGELSKERVWESYIENLRYVLDNIEVLLNNVEAPKVVISADHGEATGEWGVYNHPNELPIRALREVPWYQTEATDEQTRDPAVELTEEDGSKIDQDEVNDRLQALGYRT